jgi:nanoRNase/pAp phosphatase (c-di-AMP/oligoRNAs hydrolase)
MPMAASTVEKCRLVTRSDFDGLVCAALLKELGMLDEIKFVHPKDVQDGLVELGDRDITTNLPYVPGVRLAFDHHESEMLRLGDSPDNHIIVPGARSAARVVYEHFGGAAQFARVPGSLMEAVDKADSAMFSLQEIEDPAGWILLSFLMDPRTGLGRFRDFRISNYDLMMMLVDACLEMSVEDILQLPDVAERVNLYAEHAAAARAQLLARSTVHGNAVVVDLREDEVIHPTNRFMIYALHPECNLSIHVLWGLRRQNTVLAMGKSIIDRSSRTHIGALTLSYGGGGHDAAGTCQVANDQAERVLAELLERVIADG